MSVGQQLLSSIRADPFHAVATGIFLCAVIHTFLASYFSAIGNRFENRLSKLEDQESKVADKLRFRATFFHFMGEVEVVFGLWVIPLLIALSLFRGVESAMGYMDHVDYREPIFVTAIMIIAASRPILKLAENLLAGMANLGGATPGAWTFSILTGGTILGSLITEPAAMTICALLLGQRLFALAPSQKLKYATLGLLFVNISVGGTLTHFAAPPVVMVASKWGWGLGDMFFTFGWKAVLGISLSTGIYALIFWKEFGMLKERVAMRGDDDRERRIPFSVTCVHVGFMVWMVVMAHHTALVIPGLLFYIAYTMATEPHQNDLSIRSPMLVGFFLAALVVHGGFQRWWIEPVLNHLGEWPLMLGATALTAFNDNAAITYLASLVPDFGAALKYAVLAGAVTGGGLTVIANAPNPAGQALLRRYFGKNGISPLGLFLGAIGPAIIVGLCFMLLRGITTI